MKNEEEEEDEMNLGLHLLILIADEERAYRLWWKLKERNIGLFASPRDIWELPCDDPKNIRL